MKSSDKKSRVQTPFNIRTIQHSDYTLKSGIWNVTVLNKQSEAGNPAQRCRLIKFHNTNSKIFLFDFFGEEVCEGGKICDKWYLVSVSEEKFVRKQYFCQYWHLNRIQLLGPRISYLDTVRIRKPTIENPDFKKFGC